MTFQYQPKVGISDKLKGSKKDCQIKLENANKK